MYVLCTLLETLTLSTTQNTRHGVTWFLDEFNNCLQDGVDDWAIFTL